MVNLLDILYAHQCMFPKSCNENRVQMPIIWITMDILRIKRRGVYGNEGFKVIGDFDYRWFAV